MNITQYLIANKKILLIFFIIFFISLFAFKKYIPEYYKNLIREYIFVYSNISNLKLELEKLKKLNEYLKNEISEKDTIIFDLTAFKPEFTFVKNDKSENFEFNRKKFEITKFSNDIISNLTPRAHFEFHDDNVFLVTGIGQILYSSSDPKNFNSEKIKFKQIKTNLIEKINTNYLSDRATVIKSILIINKFIFISYVKEHNENCYTNAIFKGEFNYEKINFEDFFDTNECSLYYGNQTGGIFTHYKEDEFVFSVGDWYAYTLEDGLRNNNPQEMNSYKGKLLKFSIDDSKPDILSLGHRNPQGLRYDEKNNILFSTDHGPQGGDEINIDINPDVKDVKNYGWGIASYGEHYGYPIKNPKEYQAAPLYKSHQKYGFIEPLTYFVPSIAITQIDFVDDNLTDQRNFYVGALGNDIEEGDMSIHNIIFNKKNYWKKESHDIIPIGERVRDLKYYNNIGLLFWAEATGSIGVLKLNND